MFSTSPYSRSITIFFCTVSLYHRQLEYNNDEGGYQTERGLNPLYGFIIISQHIIIKSVWEGSRGVIAP